MEQEKEKKIKYKPLKIVTYPDSKLRRKCAPVRPEVNLEEVQQLIEVMFKTMYFYQGIGLAAPQVGIGLRVLVIDIQEPGAKPISMINPVIISKAGSQESYEGCLSFPFANGHVQRSDFVKVEYLDKDAQPQKIEATGLLAACIQHEIDHLSGILYIDHLSRLKQGMIIKKIKKRKGL